MEQKAVSSVASPQESPWMPEDLIEEKLKSLQAKLTLIVRQGEARQELAKKSIRQSENRICEIGGEILTLEQFPFMPDSPAGGVRQRLAGERARLEKEIAVEQLALWRDLYAMEAEIMNIRQEYHRMIKRRGIL